MSRILCIIVFISYAKFSNQLLDNIINNNQYSRKQLIIHWSNQNNLFSPAQNQSFIISNIFIILQLYFIIHISINCDKII